MRLNKFIADNTNLSRRSADKAIEVGQVTVNGVKATLGTTINPTDNVEYNGRAIKVVNTQPIIILLNKPVGYVCSKNGQGSKTIYDLLPAKYQNLNIAGRLDKDSCGLVVLTNDGDLLYRLTHPSNNKNKIYNITLDKPLGENHMIHIEQGVSLDDGSSKLKLKKLDKTGLSWQVTMQQGRNRQIRRTFKTLDYTVIYLQRIMLDNFKLDNLKSGCYKTTILNNKFK
jgi:23S rRNA pseudouridine2605 synthase